MFEELAAGEPPVPYVFILSYSTSLVFFLTKRFLLCNPIVFISLFFFMRPSYHILISFVFFLTALFHGKHRLTVAYITLPAAVRGYCSGYPEPFRSAFSSLMQDCSAQPWNRSPLPAAFPA